MLTDKDVQEAREILARIRSGSVSPADLTEMRLTYEKAMREIGESRA